MNSLLGMLILLSLVGCHTVKAATEYGWSAGSRQAIRGVGLTQVEEKASRQGEKEERVLYEKRHAAEDFGVSE